MRETSTQARAMIRMIRAGSKSATPSTTARRMRNPASSANLGPSPPGMWAKGYSGCVREARSPWRRHAGSASRLAGFLVVARFALRLIVVCCGSRFGCGLFHGFRLSWGRRNRLRTRRSLRPRLGLGSASRVRARLGRLDDRVGHLGGGGLAEAGSREKLLRALLRPRDDGRSLRARPFQRLLDLRPRGVRQLRRLMTGLLEQTCSASLGLTQLLARVLVGLGDELASLVARGREDLVALALALVAEALHLALALLERLLTLPYFLLRA